MDLALITRQRREVISYMKFSNIYDDRLHVSQIKTVVMTAIPFSLTVKSARLKLGTGAVLLVVAVILLASVFVKIALKVRFTRTV